MEKLQQDFGIKDLAYVKNGNQLFSNITKATHYLLLWIQEGRAEIEVDFQPIAVNGGSLLLISINQLYRLNASSDFNGKVIFFSAALFKQTSQDSHFLMNSELLHPDRLNQTVEMDPNRLNTLFSLLGDEFSKPKDAYSSLICQCYLRAILWEAERILITNRSASIAINEYELYRRFCNEVENYFKTLKHTEYYMHMLGVCEKTLTRTLKLTSEQTPKKYIIRRVVLEAKRLMAISQASVKEVAQELGFEETTNFTKYFLLHAGVTPLEFREKYQPAKKVQPLIIR